MSVHLPKCLSILFCNNVLLRLMSELRFLYLFMCSRYVELCVVALSNKCAIVFFIPRPHRPGKTHLEYHQKFKGIFFRVFPVDILQ